MEITRDNLLMCYYSQNLPNVGFTAEHMETVHQLAKKALRAETWRDLEGVKVYQIEGDVHTLALQGLGDYCGRPFIGLGESASEDDCDSYVLYIKGVILYRGKISSVFEFPEYMLGDYRW